MADTFSFEEAMDTGASAPASNPRVIPADVQVERDQKSLELLQQEQADKQRELDAVTKEIGFRKGTITKNGGTPRDAQPAQPQQSQADNSFSFEDAFGPQPTTPPAAAPAPTTQEQYPDQLSRGIANQRIAIGTPEAKAVTEATMKQKQDDESFLQTIDRAGMAGGHQMVSGVVKSLWAAANNEPEFNKQDFAPTAGGAFGIPGAAAAKGAGWVMSKLGQFVLDKDEKTGEYKPPKWLENYDAEAQVRGSAVAQMPVADAWKQGKMTQWIVGQTAQQSPQLALLAAAVIQPEIAPLVLPAMGLSAGGNQYGEDIAAGVDKHKAMLDAIVNGAVEIGSEGISFGLMKMFGPAFQKVLSLMPAGEKLAVAKKLVAGAITTAAESAAEGASEATGQVAQNASQKYIAGRKDTGLTDQVAESFFGSLGFGPLLAAGHTTAQGVARGADWARQQLRPHDKTVATDVLNGTTVGEQPAQGEPAPAAPGAPVAPEAAAPAEPAAPVQNPEAFTPAEQAPEVNIGGTAGEINDAALLGQFDQTPPAKEEGTNTPVAPVEAPVAPEAPAPQEPAGATQTAPEVSTPQPAPENAPAAPESSHSDVQAEQIGSPSHLDTSYFTATKADGELSIPQTDEERGIQAGLNQRLARVGQPQVPAGAVRIEEPTDAESRLGSSLKRAFGVSVKWVTSSHPIGVDGFVINRGAGKGDRTIYMVRPTGNANKSDAMFVAGHELTHILRQEHPDIYDAMHSAVESYVMEGARGIAQLTHNRTGDKLDEEIMADHVGTLFADPKFLSKMQRENPGAFGEFIQIAKAFIDKMVAAVQAVVPPNSRWVRDTKKARDAVHTAFTQWAQREQQSAQPNETGRIPDTAQNSGQERRKDVERRKAVEQMTPEEMKQALLTDDLTGLGNRRAYDEAPKKAITVSIDADSLKWVNDNMGHESGDHLLRVIGEALKGLDAYHISGDEFIAQFDKQGQAALAMKKVEQALKKAVLTVETPDGKTITIKGVGVTHGIAATKEQADAELNKRKDERQQSGERAARGEAPPGLVREPERAPAGQAEKAAEGKPDRKRAPRADAKSAAAKEAAAKPEAVTKQAEFDKAFERISDLQMNAELKKSQVKALANQAFAKGLLRDVDHAETLRMLQDMDAEDALDDLHSSLLYNAEQAGIAASPSRADASSEYEDRAKAALAEMNTPRGSSVPILSGQVTPDIEGTGRNGKNTVFDLGTYFQKENGANFPQGIESEAAREEVARTLAHEAFYALSQDGHAMGWYDREVKKALKQVATVHPEVLKEPEHHFSFTLITAITSNGQDVFGNFKLAAGLYREWKKTGRFPESVQGGGPRAPAMVAAFQKINELVDEHGWQSVEAFFLDRMPVREIYESTGIKPDGENMDSIVPGASAFGPKIGNFYYNLNGMFDTITMDLWWMRTINRITGRMVAIEPESFERHLASLERHLDAGVNTFGIDPAKIKAEIAKWRSWSEKRQSNAELFTRNMPHLWGYVKAAYRNFANPKIVNGVRKSFSERTPVNYNAKALMEGVTGMHDSPRNGTEREWMRDVARRAMQLMRDRGLDISAADFQAVLWYYEKDLYTKLGAANEKAKPASYSDAARAVFGGDSVEADAGASGQVRRGDGEAPEGQGRQGALELDQEAGSVTVSPSRGVNIEVAPNPDNTELADRFNALPEEQKKAATYEVADAIIPEVLKDMGIEGSVEHTIGGFEGGTQPSIILHFPENVPFDTMVEAGKALGTVFEQKAIIAYDEDNKAGSQGGFVYVEPSRPLSYNEQAELFRQIFAEMPEAAGFTGREGKLVFGNFTEMPDAEFHNKLDAALAKTTVGGVAVTSYHQFRSEWVEPVTLEGTRYEGSSQNGEARGEDSRGQGRIDSLRERATAILAKHTEAGQAGAGQEVDVSARNSADWAVLAQQARQMYQSGTKIAQIASQLKLAPKTVMKLIGSIYHGPGTHFIVEDETKAQQAERKVLDRFNRLQIVQNAIEQQGGTVDDVNNVYRALERMPGRSEARVNDFVDHELRPFIEAAADAGIDLKHIAEYAILKHAKERNAQIAKINPNFPDGGSGITNDEVDRLQADQKQRSDYAQLKALGDRFLNLTHGTRDILQRGGLLSPEERAAWEKAYKNYVPLRGGDLNDMAGEIDMSGNTGGFLDQRGALSQRAMGRYSVPDPARVFADVVQDRYAAIVRDEKNRIGKTLMKMVLDNPDPDLWGIDERKKSRVIEKDPATGKETVVERFTDNRDPKNTIVTKVGGREFVITIKDDTLAETLVKLNDHDMGVVLQAASKLNRALTKMWTQYSPVFTMTNFMRDLGTGMIHTTAEKGVKRAATVAKYIPGAVRAIWQLQRGATTGGHMFSFAQDYVHNGGKTGYVSMVSLEDRMKEMERMWKIASMHGMHPSSIAHAFLDVISDANTAIENGIRLASYRAAIESGETTVEAVSEAKNLTVNFNRRGEWTPTLNAAFLFFNPNVQGTARIVKAMKRAPKMMAGIAASQVAVAMLAAMISSIDDDDDGVSFWDKPDVQRLKSKNLILILPGTKGKRITLPLPYGYNAFFALGYALVDLSRGKQQKSAVLGSLLDAIMTGFSPVGSGNINSVIDLLPTAVQPFVQVAANRNAFGNPIYPDHGESAKPQSEKMWDSTRGTMAEAITTYLNSATQGDSHISGAISISPEVLNHLTKFVTGGVGTAIVDTVNALTQLGTIGYDDADLSRLPFRRQIFGQHQPEKDSSLYYSRLSDLKAVVASYKAAVKNGDMEKAKALREKYGDEMIDDVGGAIGAATKALKEVREAEGAIRASDLPRGAKELQMREQQRRRGEIFTQWNRMFTDANHGQVQLP